MKNTILIGPPGAGKGTMAAKMIEEFNLVHISTGDILRANIKQGTELGKLASSYIEAGKLLPDDVVAEIVADRLKQDDVTANGFLLDGYPRTVTQAEMLKKFLADNSMSLDFVLELAVPTEMLLKRLTSRRVCRGCGAVYNIYTLPPKEEGVCDKCGGEVYQRPDDNEATVSERLDVYTDQTAPLIEFYSGDSAFSTVDSSGAINENYERIASLMR